MAFTAKSSLKDLMADTTERSYGVLMSDDDEYGTKLSVHIALDNGDGTWTWVDVTDDVRALEWDRGATDNLVQPVVGTAIVTLNNLNSHYSPWNTTVGPWAGSGGHSKIVPNTPVRFGVTLWDPADHSDISWLPLFSGLIETYDETTTDNVDSFVTLNLVDVAASLAAHGAGTLMGAGPGALNAWVIGDAITMPLAITVGSNDNFKIDTTVYTIAPGTYTTLADLATAVGAAVNSVPHPLSLIITPTATTIGLLLTVVATGSSSYVLHSGTNDVLSDLGLADGTPFETYEDIYANETGAVMLPNLLTDCGYAFDFIDGVTSVDPLDPWWTTAQLQSPDRSQNRLQAAQDIGTACNVMVYGSSSGALIAQRFGPAVDGAPDFGTFTNSPDGSDHNYPIVRLTPYASTDRVLNSVTGQAAQPTQVQLEVINRDQSIGSTNGFMTTHATDAATGHAAITTHSSVGGASEIQSQAQFHSAYSDNTTMQHDYVNGIQLASTVGFKIQGEEVAPQTGNTDGNVLTRVSGVWQGAAPVVSSADLAEIETDITDLETLKAPLASPALTGTPTAPTQSRKTNNTDLATTAYSDRILFVCTSSTHPASPSAGDALIETDTGALLIYMGSTDGWQPPWNQPWGFVAEATSTTLNTGALNGTVATDLISVTFTAVANRRYQFIVEGVVTCSASTSQPIVSLVDGGNAVHGSPDEWVFCDSTAHGNSYLGISFETGIAAGSTTRKARFTAIGVGGTATFSANADLPTRITVIDVGPNGNPS